MAKLKDIKESAPSWMKMSILDVLQLIDGTPTNKYLPMLVSLIKSRWDKREVDWTKNEPEDDYASSFINELHSKTRNKTKEDLRKLSLIEVVMSIRLFEHLDLNYSEIEELIKFMDRHDNNKFKNLDVNQIKTMEDISGYNLLSSLKEIEKIYEKQVLTLLNDEKWLVVRPITYESSIKYGASTKWCTTARDSYHFFKYTRNGKLIYILNKLTGDKNAMFVGNNNDSYEVSFWDVADNRIDSLMVNIDQYVRDMLIETIKNDSKTNRELNVDIWEESKKNNDREELRKTSSYDDIPEITEERYVGGEQQPDLQFDTFVIERDLDISELRTVRVIE